VVLLFYSVAAFLAKKKRCIFF